ncbi:MAG: PAN domain-containing protein [Hyphomicrobiaceae bacterium]
MFARRLLTVLTMLVAVAALGSGTAFAGEEIEQGVDRPGGDYKDFELEPSIAGFGPCQAQCAQDKKCRAWTFVKSGVQGPKAHCWLKSTLPTAVKNDCCTTGYKVKKIGKNADIEDRCKAHAAFVVGVTKNARKANCEFLNGDGVWNKSSEEIYDSCVSSAGEVVKPNLNAMVSNMKACETAAGGDAGGGGKTAKVVKDVDVYDAPGGNGNQTGSLNTGTQVGFAGCENDWCHVTGDGVPNGDGYVYNGADYRSLKF